MRVPQLLCFAIIAVVVACNSGSEKKEVAKELAAIDVPKVVTADIEEGIKANIAKKVEEGEGYFILDTLKLQLVRVHTEYLSNLGPRRHFACVDLADISGDVYDVDFFLKGDPGNMTVTDTTLHKLNGKPMY
ncbi:MAG: transglutaminase domain-containing protein, partial [Eudoraea sp.]|nr:transglutaminase domain-containing protein [Eudoraea sp.]